MSTELEVEVAAEKRYVGFVKRRPGSKFMPFTVQGGDEIVVKALREFLDHEISRWLDPAMFIKVVLAEFIKDIEADPVNSKLAAMLGWNYASAARMVEQDGAVFILTVHPRFQSIPFSFRQVRDDDCYALALVQKIWSLRGGQIIFEEYDPEKHVPGYIYEG